MQISHPSLPRLLLSSLTFVLLHHIRYTLFSSLLFPFPFALPLLFSVSAFLLFPLFCFSFDPIAPGHCYCDSATPLLLLRWPAIAFRKRAANMNGHAYPSSPYGPPSPYHEEEETFELTAPAPQAHRNPNSFDFQFQDAAPSQRPIMPIRPGHNYSPPEYSAPWLQPNPRFSAGPDSFPNTPYDSRAASPTLVCSSSLRPSSQCGR